VGLFDRTLRARREELRLGQAQLAERVGVTQQTISRWENGEVIPPPKRLAKLAKALDLDLDQMLTYGGYLPNVADWPRWHVLNLLYDQIGDLSDDDLLLVIERAFEEVRGRLLGERQKPKNAPSSKEKTPPSMTG
jgi:transcriptional regulator with XRE-family HTH domain